MLNVRLYSGIGGSRLVQLLAAETGTRGVRPLRVLVSLLAVAAFVYIQSASAYTSVVDFSPGLLRHVSDLWGRRAPARLLNWQQFVRSTQVKSGDDRRSDSPEQVNAPPSSPTGNAERKPVQRLLATTNTFWNRIPFLSDQDHWGVTDYWATPVETQGSNGGDCEDYAIGKYFTLRELGVTAAHLRISYVRVSGLDEAHMVLAYYADVDADPLILDSLTDEILPGSQRRDLKPVYSFNDEDLWMASDNVKLHLAGEVRVWQDVLEKMAKEQRM